MNCLTGRFFSSFTQLISRLRKKLGIALPSFVSLLFLFGASELQAQTPFVCEPSAFLVQVTGTNVTSTLRGVDLNSGGVGTLAQLSEEVNGIGFNANDGFIYGFLRGSTDIVVRIDADFNVTTFGPIADLTAAGFSDYPTGDVGLDGFLYLTRFASGSPVHVIDVNTGSPDFMTVVASGTIPLSGLVDWAVNPRNGDLYGVTRINSTTVRLFRFDSTTFASTTIGDVSANMGTDPVACTNNFNFGSAYFDADGNFYAQRNCNGDIWKLPWVGADAGEVGLSAIDQGSVQDELIGNDGARCATLPGAAPFPCDGGLGTFIQNSGVANSSVVGIDLASGLSFTLDADLGMRVNGIGHNPLDNYIYGYVRTSGDLIARIGSDYEAVQFGPIAGLNSGNEYLVGDVNSNGVLQLLDRVTWTVYDVDVTLDSPTYMTLLGTNSVTPAPIGLNIGDWAISPINGNFYFISTNAPMSLNEIDGTTYAYSNLGPLSTDLAATAPCGFPAIGGAFFDADGTFYIQRNCDGDIFQMAWAGTAPSTNVTLFSTNNPTSLDNDGARCAEGIIGDPIGCVSDAFLAQAEQGFDFTDLIGLNLTSARTNSFVGLETRINAIGFNAIDGYIYGHLTGSTQYIGRIDADNNVTPLGPIPGLVSRSYFIGDVAADGHLYLARGSNVVEINVNLGETNYAQVVGTHTMTGDDAFLADWAWNPTNGNFYAIAAGGPGGNVTAHLVRVDSSTFVVTDLGMVSTNMAIPPPECTDNFEYGAAYFDVNGNFYSVRNCDGSVFFLPRSGTTVSTNALLFSSLEREVAQNDGARCPFALVLPDVDVIKNVAVTNNGDSTYDFRN